MTMNPEPGGTGYWRRLERADAPAVWEIEKACFSLPWSVAQISHAFTQQAFAALGFFAGGSLGAYLSVYHVADELEILNLAVLPGLRRRGLGRRLLGAALQAAPKMGMQKAWLEVRATNLAAIGLYESCGFRRAGRRRGYYTDSGEDALVYCRQLQPED